MRNLFTTKVKVILVIAALLTAAFAILSGITASTPPGVVVQGALAPFRGAVTALTNLAEKYYGYMFQYQDLQQENAQLEARIAQMEDAARQADSVSRENQRLRTRLGLTATQESFTLVDCDIIGWSTADWEYTFTINRGTTSGIDEGMCAITYTGEVVGLVTEAGLNYAQVTTVLDSTLAISGTISTSGYNGMVQGGFVTGSESMLRMSGLPTAANLWVGDQVVTSGSTVYPRGLIIGTVLDAAYEDDELTKYALLDPAAQIASLKTVQVITAYTTVPEDPVQVQTDPTTPQTTAPPAQTTAPQTTAPQAVG